MVARMSKPEKQRKRRQNELLWQDFKVAKHIVNQQKLMDGRKNFSSTQTPYLQRTTLMLLLWLTGAIRKFKDNKFAQPRQQLSTTTITS